MTPTRVAALIVLALMTSVQCLWSQKTTRNSIRSVKDSFPFYFQTRSSGNWDDYHTWDSANYPMGPWFHSKGQVPSHDNGYGTTIQSGHTITVAQVLEIDGTQIDGQVIVSSGKTLTLSGGNTLTLNGTLRIQGTFILGNADSHLSPSTGSLVVYNGSGPQTVVRANYVDLQIDNSHGAALTEYATVAGTLTLKNGVFAIGASNISFNRDASIVRQNGSLSGTPLFTYLINVTYAGTSAVTTGPEIPTSPTVLDNLAINNSGDVTLGGSPEVHGTLSVTSANLITGSNTLTLGSYATMTETAPYAVLGMMYTSRACTTGTTEFFGGMGLEITPTAGSYPTISVQRTTGAAQTIAGATAIKRYFDVSGPSGLNAGFVFHYSANELNGANESNLKLYKRGEVSPWTNVGGTLNTSAHTLALSGVNSFSQWTAAAETGPPTVTAISPSFELQGNTLDVTITGTNFVNGGSTVGFSESGITVNSVTWSSSTQIAANISIDPAAPTGFRTVSVTTANGIGTLPSAFEVRLPPNPVPTLTNVTPSTGTRGQTVSVKLTGSGFVSGITTVSFGESISVSVVPEGSPTLLTTLITIAPRASLGAHGVTVTNPSPGGGTATLPNAFTVSNPTLTLSSLSPACGNRGQSLVLRLRDTLTKSFELGKD